MTGNNTRQCHKAAVWCMINDQTVTSVKLKTWLHTNGPWHGHFDLHMHTQCWELIEHHSSSSTVILTSFHFHYTYSWHYLCNQKHKVAHINSKLRLKNHLEAKFPCPKCGKKTEIKNPSIERN